MSASPSSLPAETARENPSALPVPVETSAPLLGPVELPTECRSPRCPTTRAGRSVQFSVPCLSETPGIPPDPSSLSLAWDLSLSLSQSTSTWCAGSFHGTFSYDRRHHWPMCALPPHLGYRRGWTRPGRQSPEMDSCNPPRIRIVPSAGLLPRTPHLASRLWTSFRLADLRLPT